MIVVYDQLVKNFFFNPCAPSIVILRKSSFDATSPGYIILITQRATFTPPCVVRSLTEPPRPQACNDDECISEKETHL